jgi:hypothetical protein
MFASGRRRLRGLLHPEPSFDPTAGPFEQALFRFNESETGRTVARLIRILGTPSVSVGTAAGAPGVVRVTVAWELSWYQWGVDVANTRVFEIAKGGEVDQLDPAARQWNAGVAKDGKLRLRS